MKNNSQYMYKALTVIVSITAILFPSFSSSSTSAEQSARTVVEKYFKALTKKELKTAAGYWEGTFPYINDIKRQCDKDLVNLMLENTSWEINGIPKNNLVEVTVKEPEIAGKLKEIMDTSMGRIVNSGITMNELQNRLCEEMGKEITQISPKEIKSLGKKESKRCYKVSTKGKIISRTNSPCPKP